MEETVGTAHHPRKIPPEICDTILELVQDRNSLKACALVSRSSLQTAQRLLFSTICLQPPNFFDIQHNSCARFHTIISESPHLTAYVRHLFIVDGHHEFDLNWVDNPRWKTTISCRSTCQYVWIARERKLSDILLKLVNLNTLTIRGPDSRLKWNELFPETQNALLCVVKRPQLTTIELFGTFGFIPLLTNATSLNTLSLVGNDMSWRERGAKTAKLCQLHSLNVAFGLDHLIIDIAIDSWLDLSRLRTLILRGELVRTQVDLVFPTHMLGSSETLEHLHLEFDSTLPTNLLTSLSSFPRLRSLYLDIRQHTTGTAEVYQEWFTRLFLTIPDCSQIKTIAFRLSFTHPLDLFSNDGYTNLDKALIRSELRSLTFVRVNVGKVDFTELPTYRARLPFISALGILSVEPDAKWAGEYNLCCNEGCFH